MLLNFCDPRLKTEVYCSTVHTEGYDATNLITGSSKGFLAYSCIRPPVNIDFTFACNVQIHHVLLWPTVGSQRSSGFQLHAKTTTDCAAPYTMLAKGCLKPDHTGLLFYSSKADVNSVAAPATFLKRYVPARMECWMSYTNSLRVCISKTENSVPALGGIEVWGTVSPRCGKDVVANIYALWTNSNEVLTLSKEICTNSADGIEDIHSGKQGVPSCLEVPENLLDAITCEIMSQPIILPSGKIIDQTTLDKYERNEAIWGRSPSDPFTGLPFTEKRRPIIATALKAKVDKFLLDNSDAEEVKRIPRVLGHAKLSFNTITAVTSNERAADDARSLKSKLEGHRLPVTLESHKTSCDSREQMTDLKMKRAHRLPVVTIRHKRTSALVKSAKKTKTLSCCTDVPEHDRDNIAGSSHEGRTSDVGVENDLNAAVRSVLSSLKHFGAPEKTDQKSTPRACNCCRNAVLYRLPCAHIVCRKVLTSTNHFKCNVCEQSCLPREIERIHN